MRLSFLRLYSPLPSFRARDNHTSGVVLQVIWFKRDLRVEDHRALARAAQRGPVLPLYVVEPELWQQPDMSARQWAFVHDCLSELQPALARLGQALVIRLGSVEDVLQRLHQTTPFTALWSHQETGNDWTFQRDRRVQEWCRAQGIVWHELRNHGVVRRLASRNGWAAQWDRFMAEPRAQAPTLEPLTVEPGNIPSLADLGLSDDVCLDRQSGGRTLAQDTLQSFLVKRARTYRRDMSSPLAGAQACSRLSPHLAWGSISMREVMQATWQHQAKPPVHAQTADWRGSVKSFAARLHWHCHFIQKLEDAPRLEFENLHRAYDGLRSKEPDAVRLAAWQNGETGLPFVDACMRCLAHTGWLNFRMRAMVMATASYHLWLDWRAPGLYLARQFTDYEPGIHWSQVQMQSGTTGINTIRIYNPVKQGHDQDPTGVFTRHWLPELADIPDAQLQEPWTAENADQVLGHRYPYPIIDHLAAARSARDTMWGLRKGNAFRSEASVIQSKHGSRKSGIRNRGQRRRAPSAQLTLPFGD